VKSLLIAGALIVLIGAPVSLFLLSSATTVELQPELKVLGSDNALGVKFTNPHGVKSWRVRLEQGSAVSQSGADAPADRVLFWRKNLPPSTYKLQLPASPKSGFRSGPAKLTLEATSNDLRARTDSRSYDVIVNLDPPRVETDGAQHYINLGGAELVTFKVSGYWTEAGVRVGKYEFRSFPMPGGGDPAQRFCLFAYPWDTPTGISPVVFARNPAGQEARASFWFKVFPKVWRKRTLELDDAFLEKAVNEIEPGGTGNLLERFLKINRETRRANNLAMAELRRQTEEKFLWKVPFEQLSNSQVEAQFADIRSYAYQGKKVDEQTHLGFDLSKTAAAPVVSSNSGKVVFAGRLGIYGNCVVVDHGYGLQSIYAHLSSIAVKPGDVVERRQELGRSGATGLAGGDHLHYSMQLDGVQINPVEWWDSHWIQDRVLSKLPAGMVSR
jgi:hypothetical protein